MTRHRFLKWIARDNSRGLTYLSWSLTRCNTTSVEDRHCWSRATNLAQWKNQSSSSSSSSPPSRWNARKQNGGRTDSLNDTNTRPFHGSTRFWVTLNRELYTPARYADNCYLWVDGKAWIPVFLFLLVSFLFRYPFSRSVQIQGFNLNQKSRKNERNDSFSPTRSLKLKPEFPRLTTFHGIRYTKKR